MSPTTIIASLKRFRSGIGPDPERDWLALIVLSLTAFAVIIVLNIRAFDIVASGGVIGAAATTTPPLFNRASLDAINSIFANRTAEDAKYQTGVYRFSDPSQ